VAPRTICNYTRFGFIITIQSVLKTHNLLPFVFNKFYNLFFSNLVPRTWLLIIVLHLNLSFPYSWN
jgi:hypothetical protein